MFERNDPPLKSDQEIISLGRVDPRQFNLINNKLQNQIFYQLLEEQNPPIPEEILLNCMGRQTVEITLDNEIKKISFQLVRAIKRNKSKSNQNENRYEIFDSELGSGGAGIINKTVRMKPIKGSKTLVVETHKIHVIKKYHNNKKELAKKEKISAEQAGYKAALTADGKWVIFPYINGKSLDEELKNKSNEFSLLDRLKIIIQIKRALQMLHLKNYAHLDVKTANILIDQRRNIYLIDFDQCCKIGDPLTTMGTLHIAAPEKFNSKGKFVDLKTDIYEEAKTAAEILKLGCLSFEIRDNGKGKEAWEYIEEQCTAYSNKGEIVFKTENSFIEGKSLAGRIIETLNLATKFEIHERPDDNAMLQKWESIKVDLIIEEEKNKNPIFKDDEFQKNLRSVNQDALKAREAYLGLIVGVNDLYEVNYQGDLIKIMNDHLENIENNKHESYLIEEFVDSLGINALRGCKSKKSISERIIEIYKDADIERASCKQIRNENQGNPSERKEKWIRKIDRNLERVFEKPYDLDRINNFTKKISDANYKLKVDLALQFVKENSDFFSAPLSENKKLEEFVRKLDAKKQERLSQMTREMCSSLKIPSKKSFKVSELTKEEKTTISGYRDAIEKLSEDSLLMENILKGNKDLCEFFYKISISSKDPIIPIIKEWKNLGKVLSPEQQPHETTPIRPNEENLLSQVHSIQTPKPEFSVETTPGTSNQNQSETTEQSSIGKKILIGLLLFVAAPIILVVALLYPVACFCEYINKKFPTIFKSEEEENSQNNVFQDRGSSVQSNSSSRENYKKRSTLSREKSQKSDSFKKKSGQKIFDPVVGVSENSDEKEKIHSSKQQRPF